MPGTCVVSAPIHDVAEVDDDGSVMWARLLAAWVASSAEVHELRPLGPAVSTRYLSELSHGVHSGVAKKIGLGRREEASTMD